MRVTAHAYIDFSFSQETIMSEAAFSMDKRSSRALMRRATVQRSCACGQHTTSSGECRECGRSRAPDPSAASRWDRSAGPPAPVSTHSGGGMPLDASTLADLNPRFGHDFSHVRVHADARAADAARAEHALAYTVGENMVFGPGQYAPGTRAGRILLAHELAHVVQQTEGRPQGGVSTDDALEKEAQEVAIRTVSGAGALPVRRRSDPGMAKQSDPSPPKLRHHGLTTAERSLLNEVRLRLVPSGERSTAIVGVLITEDGRRFEFASGGGQGFSAHIEGKATAKMEELGLRRATLLVEKEPCQICDRSTYSQLEGPEQPMKSTKTGRPIARQTPKINTALTVGSELTVVDPDSASLYRGVKSAPRAPTPPRAGGGSPPEKSAPRQVAEPAPTPPSNIADRPTAPSSAARSGHEPAPSAGGRVTAPVPDVPAKPPSAPVPATPPSVSAPALSAEARAAARAAARDLATDFKILRVAKSLTVAMQVVGGIAQLQTLSTFMGMTRSALSGQGFVLTKEIGEVEKLNRDVAAAAKGYTGFSSQLTATQLSLFRAALDRTAAGQAAISLDGTRSRLQTLATDLRKQKKLVDAAGREVDSKRKAAEVILGDPKASSAIAAATFGTAELATLFAASQDLQRISSSLHDTSVKLDEMHMRVAEDFEFVNGWYQLLMHTALNEDRPR